MMNKLSNKLILEHKSQPLISRKKFRFRLLNYALLAVFLIFISVLIGAIGYKIIGHLTWVDSFHETCMILTGMGPVVEMKTDAAKIFSSIYALYSGVAFLSIIAVFFAPIVHRFLHVLHVDK